MTAQPLPIDPTSRQRVINARRRLAELDAKRERATRGQAVFTSTDMQALINARRIVENNR